MNKNKKEKAEQYIYDLGFIYELSSNLGILAGLEEYEILNKDLDKKNKLYSLIKNNTIYRNQIINFLKEKHKNKHLNQYKESDYDKMCEITFFNGYIQGRNKIKNYINSISKHSIKSLYYFQSNFINPLGLEKLVDDEFNYYKELINIFFKKEMTINEYNDIYMQKGQFLKSDCIVALLDNYNDLHLLVIDNKLDLSFLLKHFKSKNVISKNYIGDIEALALLLNSKNKKTQFKNSNTDTSSLDFDFSSSIMKYATVSNDKNLLKVVQSGSYAQSFISYLLETDEISNINRIKISLVGDTDSDYAIVKLNYNNKKHKKMLRKMRESYKNFDRDITQDEKITIISKGYKQLLQSLNKEHFHSNKKEFEKILNLDKNDNIKIVVKDLIKDYTPTTAKVIKNEDKMESVREQHTKLLNEFIEDKEKIICFMSGCPGIGKTYGIKSKLKQLDSYYMMYLCPRNALIEDFVQDLYIADENGRVLRYDDLIIIGASSTDEKEENELVIQVINYDTNNDYNLPTNSKFTYKKRDRLKNHTNNGLSFTYDNINSEIEVEQERNDGVISRVTGASRELVYNSEGINKIIVPITIQSLKKTSGSKNTAGAFEKVFLKDIVKTKKITGKYVDSKGFDKFVEKCPNLYIMIDEVTGSSEGAHMYKEIYNTFVKNFYNLLNDEQKSRFTLKIFVADASLPNKDMMLKHLNNVDKVEKDKIYFSSISKLPKKGAYIEEVDKQTIVLNANAYPAYDLTSKYHIYVNTHKIKTEEVDLEKERKNINKVKYDIEESVNKDIVKNIIDDIKEKQYKQTIVFIQNKKKINEIVIKLKHEWEKKYNEKLELNKDYVILNAELTDADRIKIIDYVNKDSNEENNKLKFAFITSTASRGISFKHAKSMHIVLQQFGVESFLTELIQAIYRPRGNAEFDNKTSKELNYYLTNVIYNEDKIDSDFEYKKNSTLLSILSYITLLKGCVETRIKGYSQICSSNVSIVPVGGKYITSSNYSLLEDIGSYMKILSDLKINTMNIKDDKEAERVEILIDEIKEGIIKCFSSARITTSKTIFKDGYTKETIFDSMINIWQSQDLEKLTTLDALYNYKIVNGMIIFKITNIFDELSMLKSLEENRAMLLKLLKILMTYAHLLDRAKQATQHIISLLEYELTKEIYRTANVKEKGNILNRYIAFPLYSFANYKNIIKYNYKKQYSNDKEDSELNVLEVMKSTIKEYSPSDNFLPIISNFEGAMPFVTFKSDNLESIYNEIFNQDYLLSSTTTNIFNVAVLNK